MTTYNKLVRDKVPQILDEKQVRYEQHIADPDEYKTALIKKLQEEVLEFAEEASMHELADVAEVLEALKQLPEYAHTELMRIKKRDERGGFDGRIILKGEKD